MPTRGSPSAKTRIQADTNREIVRLLRLAHDRVTSILARQPSDYQRWALPQLRRQIEAKLAEFGDAGGKTAVAGQQRAWDAGQAMVDGALSSGKAGDLLVAQLPALDTGQLEAMTSFLTAKIGDIGTAVANAINQELGLVIIGAQTPSEAIAKVARIFGGNRTRAITVVRTELGRAFATASQRRMEQAAGRIPGLKKQWRRSGKLHPRENHEAIDGQIRDVDEPFDLPNGVQLMHPRDPAAPASETINCGCESLPYMDTWDLSTPGARPLSDAEIRARKSRGQRLRR